jgi:hypothetical protein
MWPKLDFLDDPPATPMTAGSVKDSAGAEATSEASCTVMERWDSVTAIGLMHTADSLVATLGVSGRNPAVSAAASRVVEAGVVRDMQLLRKHLREFEGVVRALHETAGAKPTERG